LKWWGIDSLESPDRPSGVEGKSDVNLVLPPSHRIGRWTTLFLALSVLAGLYAALNYRGMYADGSHYLVMIAKRAGYYFPETNRQAVEWLRQTPTVVLRKWTDLSLPALAQVFSASILLAPILLVGLCWPILPASRKPWIVFPLLHLFVGVSASAFGAIGEGATSASYFWLLLFVLLFRTTNDLWKMVCLVLFVPAFYLQETTVLLTFVIMGACVSQWISTCKPGDKIFYG
jgi:hypothetical protein